MLDEWPTVAVLIVTYQRPQEIRATIDALREHLKYKGTLQYTVCDDGSPEGYIQDLQDDYPDLELVVSVSLRKGWAGNVNIGMRTCVPANYIFLCEDDYIALWDLDITTGVALLEAQTDLGLVRYDGIAGHRLDLQLREADTAVGRLNYLRISKKSPDLNIYSNRPHLKHRRFHDAYGTYLVGKSLGSTEDDFAHRVKDKEGPDVACLTTGIPLAFDHIGHSWKGSTEDVHD